MSKHIVEELPARKHAPAAAPAKGKGDEKGGTEQSSEKRIRQAVYDIRYRARREDIDIKQAFSQYMSHSSLNQAERTAVRAKLFGKKGGVAEQYAFESVDWAVDTVANAMYKVFVEKIQEEQIVLPYEQQLFEDQDKKYKVRVTDPKTDRSYVRYATRDKITQLRGRGLKVEMTEYGEPYEGERKRGEKTARALGGGGKKKLDPVGREDADIDNDGDVDKSDKYLHKRRKAIGKAIAVRKEEFLSDGTTSTEGQNTQKITGQGVDNSKLIKVFPQDSADPRANGGVIQAGTELEGPFLTERAVSKAQQRFMGMVYAVKKGKEPMSPEVASAAKEMTKKEAKKFAKTKHEGLPVHKEAVEVNKGERDTRADYAYRAMFKNKLRSAMGAKNPMVLADPEKLEKDFDKIATADNAKVACETNSYEGELLDERTRERKGQPRPARDRAMEMVRKMPEVKKGLMTRSGKTVAQHEKERGVPERDRPRQPEQTTADRLKIKKQRAAASQAAVQRSREEEDRRRRLA
jgi:hypothetical protein